jgi:adenylate cyclase, class 2
MYEVELKFAVADRAALEERLTRLGATISDAHAEADTYFSHPGRDFAQTDEALRIRRKGEANRLTYKGPKIDAATKTRHEIDLPFPSGESAAQAWTVLLEALGFAAVGQVRKSRRKAAIPWQGRSVEGSLDAVESLGNYFELELLAEPAEVESARSCILALAAELGLDRGERRSYRELLKTK